MMMITSYLHQLWDNIGIHAISESFSKLEIGCIFCGFSTSDFIEVS